MFTMLTSVDVNDRQHLRRDSNVEGITQAAGPSSPARVRGLAHCSPNSSPSAVCHWCSPVETQARLTEVRQRVQRLAPGIDVELVVGDLGTEAGVEDSGRGNRRTRFDVLVNNAGFGTHGPLHGDRRADRDRDLIAVNVDALVRLTHAVLPGMLARGHGGFSMSRRRLRFSPARIRPPMERSKAFVLSFSQAVRAETQGSGRHRDGAVPGATRTGFVDALGCRRVAAPRSTSTSLHPNRWWPRDSARSIADGPWSSRVGGTG